jgi:hypothetical protein
VDSIQILNLKEQVEEYKELLREMDNFFSNRWPASYRLDVNVLVFRQRMKELGVFDVERKLV